MIVIGEKINGAIPSVAKAIEERNADWIRNLAKIQADAGADFLVSQLFFDNEKFYSFREKMAIAV